MEMFLRVLMKPVSLAFLVLPVKVNRVVLFL